MKLIITPKEQWEHIKPIWRILLAAIVVQLAGGVISIISSKYGHPFIDFWYGGAISTFPGFIIGSFWHHHSSPEKLKYHKFAFFFIGAICLCLMIFAFFMPLEQMASQIKMR